MMNETTAKTVVAPKKELADHSQPLLIPDTSDKVGSEESTNRRSQAQGRKRRKQTPSKRPLKLLDSRRR
jgi:hypothetical protein